MKAATTLAGRLATHFGHRLPSSDDLTHLFPTPEVVADANPRNLVGLGLPKKRAEAICALARAVCEKKIRFERVINSDAFLAQIREIPGIGGWTAQYIAMRALGEPDAFPTGDGGLLRALDLRTSSELEKRAEAWRPWRSYASIYIWNTVRD